MDDIIIEKDYRRNPEDICEGSPEIDILNQARLMRSSRIP